MKSPGYKSQSTCAFPTCRRPFSPQGQSSPWFHVSVLKCRVNVHLITTSLLFHMDSASLYLCGHLYEIRKISNQLAVGQNYVWNSNKNYHYWWQKKKKRQAFPVMDIVFGIRRSQAATMYQWTAWSLYLHTHSTMQDRIRKREVRKEQRAQDKDCVINEEKVFKNPNDLQRLSTSHQQASAQPLPRQQLL